MNKKRFLPAFLVIVFLFVSINSFAADNPDNSLNKSDKIDKIMSELMRVKLDIIVAEKNNDKKDAYTNLEKSLEKKLFDLGVSKNKKEDIEFLVDQTSKNTSSDTNIRSATLNPTFPSNVDVYSYTLSITVRSITYPEKIFFVMPKSGSNMIRHENAFNVLNTPSPFSSWKDKIIKIYSDKLVGTVIGLYPIISWLPYELLSGAPTYTSMDQYDISVDLTSNMKYMYVYYASSDAWGMPLVTQKVYGREVHNFRAVNNGQPVQIRPVDKYYEIPAPYFLDADNQSFIYQKLYDGNGLTYCDQARELKYYDESANPHRLVKTIYPPYASSIIDLH